MRAQAKDRDEVRPHQHLYNINKFHVTITILSFDTHIRHICLRTCGKDTSCKHNHVVSASQL